MRQRALVLFSGGIDSTLCVAWTLRRGYRPTTLEFDFPDRPARERQAADAILQHYGVRRRVRLSLDQPLAPIGFKPRGYIPGRNLLLHAAAQAVAESMDASIVVAGHLETDAEDYPDASHAFLRGVSKLAAKGRKRSRRIPIRLPLAGAATADRARMARRWDVPIHLTWSCWRNGRRPCHACDSCRERDEFLAAEGDSTRRPPWVERFRTATRRRPD